MLLKEQIYTAWVSSRLQGQGVCQLRCGGASESHQGTSGTSGRCITSGLKLKKG